MTATGEAAMAAAKGGVVYRRVLLKLSGEALLGTEHFGIAPESLQVVAHGVGELRSMGVEVALVIGPGNIFRGSELVRGGMERSPRTISACLPRLSMHLLSRTLSNAVDS